MKSISEKMGNVREKMNLWILKGQMKCIDLLKQEDGDTNFISIAIVLVIVLAVAVVFIGFKNQVLSAVNKAISEFMTALGS